MTGDRLPVNAIPALDPNATSQAPLQLDLRFAADNTGRTWLERQSASYPFHVGRCLSMPGDPAGMATVYVQSCSGGIFAGDRLSGSVVAGPHTRAHLSTSASTVVHSMERGEAVQTTTLDAGEGAFFEYLPEPLILFPRARLVNRLSVRLHETATVVLWDAILTHDPQQRGSGESHWGESHWFDRLESEVSVRSCDGRLWVRDRYVAAGALLAQNLAGINASHTCQGTFMLLHRGLPATQLVSALRDALREKREAYAGVSALPNACGVGVRVLAPDAIALRAALQTAWHAARELLLGSPPGVRRR
ncbi:MAG: urease accessory protein UreD [Betaproteobacteria bacterium]